MRHRPLTAFGPTAATCTTSSSFERWFRSRICSSFMPSTQWCESISLLSGMPRLNWWANSRTDAWASPEPRTCSTILRTSQPVQSVGVAHSSGVSDATRSAKRVNSSSASTRASGRVIRFGIMSVCSFHSIVDVEIDETVEMTGPTVAAGVIARLRLHQAGDHGHDAVDVALFGDAGLVDQLVGASQHILGEDVGLGRRRESRHVALEEQLVPRRVLERERDELSHELLQGGARVAGELDSVEPVQQLPIAVGEHGVVQRQLRIEVGVERGLAHPHLTGQRVQRHPGDPVLAGELPRRLDDRGHLGLSTLRDPVHHQPITPRHP